LGQCVAGALPLAACVWLLFKDWRRALLVAGIVGGVSLILFLIIKGITRGGFFYNIVTANVNEFGVDRLRWNLRDLRYVLPVLVGIAGASFFRLVKCLPGRWFHRTW
jgi:hypothetical protein